MADETQASAANNADDDSAGGSTSQENQDSPIDQIGDINDLAQLEAILNESNNPSGKVQSEDEACGQCKAEGAADMQADDWRGDE